MINFLYGKVTFDPPCIKLIIKACSLSENLRSQIAKNLTSPRDLSVQIQRRRKNFSVNEMIVSMISIYIKSFSFLLFKIEKSENITHHFIKHVSERITLYTKQNRSKNVLQYCIYSFFVHEFFHQFREWHVSSFNSQTITMIEFFPTLSII